jgi:hypothetical protein
LYTNFDKPEFKNHFKKPRFSNNAFTIAHYAHDVQYEAENFLDKNKDSVPDEHMSLLQSTGFDFLKEVLDKAASSNPVPTVSGDKTWYIYVCMLKSSVHFLLVFFFIASSKQTYEYGRKKANPGLYLQGKKLKIKKKAVTPGYSPCILFSSL